MRCITSEYHFALSPMWDWRSIQQWPSLELSCFAEYTFQPTRFYKSREWSDDLLDDSKDFRIEVFKFLQHGSLIGGSEVICLPVGLKNYVAIHHTYLLWRHSGQFHPGIYQ